MEYRPLDLTIISAKGLRNANLFGKMKVYAAAGLSSDPRSKKKRTPVDRDGGKNPTWKFSMEFSFPSSGPNNLFLHIQLKCRCLFGHRIVVGEVHIPVNDLLLADGKPAQFVSYQVRRPSGKPQGVLSLSYKFRDRVDLPGRVSDCPSVVPVWSMAGAYPYQVPPVYPACCGGSLVPPQTYVYGYPPPKSYGYGYECPTKAEMNKLERSSIQDAA